jgi:peptidoglycan/xylan/chitin deacetylase (PgdA/CDA1 family)
MTSRDEHINGSSFEDSPSGRRAGRSIHRTSVPSSREQLEQESRQYSSNSGTGSWKRVRPEEESARNRAASSLDDASKLKRNRPYDVNSYGHNPTSFAARGAALEATTPSNRRGIERGNRYDYQAGSLDGSNASGSRRSARSTSAFGAQNYGTGEFRHQGTDSFRAQNYGRSGQDRYGQQDHARSAQDRYGQQDYGRGYGQDHSQAGHQNHYEGRQSSRNGYQGQTGYSAQRYSTGRTPRIPDDRRQPESHSAYRTGQIARVRDDGRTASRHQHDQEPERGHRRRGDNGNGGNGGNGGGFIPMGTSDRPRKQRSIRPLYLAVIVIAVLVIGGFAISNWNENRAVTINLNGNDVQVEGQQRSLTGLLDTNTVTVNPGDYVAVDDSVLRAGEGNRADATINNKKVKDLDTHLYDGDVVTLKDGSNITEPHTDTNEKTLGFNTVIQGSGSVHIYTQLGKKGKQVTRTGNESGITVDKVVKEPVDTVMTNYRISSKGDKVIALTFDDGPWDGTTEDILDTLKENDVKATFFTIGRQIPEHEDLIKRMKDEGHQICTHTYDHAEGSGKGVNITYMSESEQREEIEKGYEAISKVTGEDASTVVRLPGGNLDEATAGNLSDLITAEIGWSVDTMDWSRPGTDSIYQTLMDAGGGAIVLMHDGGGDRTQTAAALKKALPKLIEQGYTFVTIDEMLEDYPYEGETAN